MKMDLAGNLLHMPRLIAGSYRIASFGWLHDHIFWNRNRQLEVSHVCFCFGNFGGVSRTLVNQNLHVHDNTRPWVGAYPAGTRLHTLEACRHEELFLTFSEPDFEGLTARGLRSGSFDMNSHIQEALAYFYGVCEHLYHPGGADRLDGAFLRLADEVILQMNHTENNAEAPRDPVIAAIASYLSMNFMRPLSLEELCSRFALDRRTFYRKWRTFSAEPPAAFLRAKRLELAASLLKNTRLQIKEIAERCGFSGPAHLAACFREIYHSSPGEWRRN